MPFNDLKSRLKTPLATALYLLLLSAPTIAWAGPFESGMAAYQEKDYQRAIPLFRQAAAESPENPSIRYYLADALLKSNRIGEAQAEYNQVLALAPDSQAARLSQQALANLKNYAFQNSTRLQVNGALAGRSEDKLTGMAAGEDNYLDDVSNAGKYVRWSLLKPLKVYVEKTPKGISHFEPGFISTVPQALAAWSRALGGQLQYMMLSTPEQADIIVTWVNSIDRHGFVKDNTISFTAGLTTPVIESNQLKEMRMRIATLDIKGKPQGSDGIYHTVLHEFGHALGLLGHSGDAHDLMFVQSADQATLTQRDINTIRKLYLMDADISNKPPDAERLKDPTREKRIAGAIDKSIARYEAQAKVLGNSLSWINLGVNYAKKALALKESRAGNPDDPKSQPNYWNQKAIAAYTKGLELEPQNIWAFTRRATVYSELKQPDKALADVTQAIKIAPREADLYLQQAQILIELDRKPEASNALNTFKNLAPNAATSAAYKAALKQL